MLPRPLRFAPLLALALLFGSSLPAAAVTFVDSGASLLGASGSIVRGAMAWGDYDGDSDLDLLAAGSIDGLTTGNRTRLYRNNGGAFVVQPTALPNLANGALAWGDYDRDGDLDLAVQGIDSTSVRMARIYRNDGGGTFVDIAAGLTAVAAGGLAWGDFDNDGDLDLALCGSTNGVASGAQAKVYRNDGGTFVDASTGIAAGGHIGAVAFGDVDGDGDQDLVVTGFNTSNTPTASLYRNTAGSWVAATSGLTGVAQGAALAFGDVDSDGYLDLAVLGSTNTGVSGGIVRIYLNDGTGAFINLGAAIGGLSSGSVSWGDFDGDGDPDLLASGYGNGGGVLTYIARNDGGYAYTQTSIAVTSVGQAAVAWGDYDNDGRLDIALAGIDGSSNRIARIYRNTDAPLNAAPGTPGGLSTAAVAGPTPGSATVTFSWTAPSDDHTAQNGLSYELRVGTTPGGSEVTGAAAATTGFRRVARFGGTGGRESWALTLPLGTYTWSMHAVDGGLRGGAFAAEQSVNLEFLDSGVSLLGAGPSSGRPGMAWGDYDQDGDLDLVVAGAQSSDTASVTTRLYRNDSGNFVVVPAALPDVGAAAFAWGDYDRDGDLDLAMEGAPPTGGFLTRIYRNDGSGVFVDIAAGLTGLRGGNVAWGDFDNDGDLDLAACGTMNYQPFAGSTTKVYRNDGGTFVDASGGITPAGQGGSLAFGDVDGDGDLDLLVTGSKAVLNGPYAQLYRNDSGAWTPVASGLTGVDLGTSVAFGDVDFDGDLDVALLGITNPVNAPTVKIYSNDGTGAFTDLGAPLTGLSGGSLAWGDLDGDGDLDLLAAGAASGVATTYFARNNGGGTYTQVAIAGANVSVAAVACGDYDDDGRLDLAIAGRNPSGTPITKLYHNVSAAVNASPGTPAGLTATRGDDPNPGAVASIPVTFAWTAPSDDHTPTNGLSYELRVGTTPGGSEITGAAANGTTGFRRVARFGPTGGRESWTLNLQPGVYYWSVQSVDGGVRGSAPAAEQPLTLIRYVSVAVLPLGFYPIGLNAMAAGDQDGDGDLDLVVMVDNITNLYRNDGGSFTVVPTALPSLSGASLAWGDYDRDGDLDLAVMGIAPSPGYERILRIYRNDGPAAFTDIGAGLPALQGGRVAWGDIDGDGDLDLVASGRLEAAYSMMTKCWRNDAGMFVDASAGLETHGDGGGLALGDLDRDGDLDLVVTGYFGDARATLIYRNDGGAWVSVPHSVTAVVLGSVALGDYDSDGDLDLGITGSTTGDLSAGTTNIYTNDGSMGFTPVAATLDGLTYSAGSWGDLDGDGDLDFFASGNGTTGTLHHFIAGNDGGGVFTQTTIYGAAGTGASANAIADFDGDGRLDLAEVGRTAYGCAISRALGAPVNTPPTAPTGLGAYLSGTHKVLHWNVASDAKTPAGGLSYDVRIGTSTRGGQIVSLPADSVSGLRQLAQRGAAQADSFVITLPNGIYYYTVQAVDAGFAGSALPAWQTVPGGVVGVDDPRESLPVAFAIRGVSPNPVIRTARVAFDLPLASEVDLSVFDVAGRRVATLLRARMAAGRQLAAWDGRGEAGTLPAGVYLMRLSAAGHTDTRRVVVAR